MRYFLRIVGLLAVATLVTIAAVARWVHLDAIARYNAVERATDGVDALAPILVAQVDAALIHQWARARLALQRSEAGRWAVQQFTSRTSVNPVAELGRRWPGWVRRLDAVLQLDERTGLALQTYVALWAASDGLDPAVPTQAMRDQLLDLAFRHWAVDTAAPYSRPLLAQQVGIRNALRESCSSENTLVLPCELPTPPLPAHLVAQLASSSDAGRVIPFLVGDTALLAEARDFGLDLCNHSPWAMRVDVVHAVAPSEVPLEGRTPSPGELLERTLPPETLRPGECRRRLVTTWALSDHSTYVGVATRIDEDDRALAAKAEQWLTGMLAPELRSQLLAGMNGGEMRCPQVAGLAVREPHVACTQPASYAAALRQGERFALTIVSPLLLGAAAEGDTDAFTPARLTALRTSLHRRLMGVPQSPLAMMAVRVAEADPFRRGVEVVEAFEDVGPHGERYTSLRAGDVVLSINGEDVFSLHDLTYALNSAALGAGVDRPLALRIQRDGQQLTVQDRFLLLAARFGLQESDVPSLVSEARRRGFLDALTLGNSRYASCWWRRLSAGPDVNIQDCVHQERQLDWFVQQNFGRQYFIASIVSALIPTPTQIFGAAQLRTWLKAHTGLKQAGRLRLARALTEAAEQSVWEVSSTFQASLSNVASQAAKAATTGFVVAGALASTTKGAKKW